MSNASSKRIKSAAVAMLLLVGCGTPIDEPRRSFCADVETDCTPAYEPTFDNIHERTLSETCALAKCHATESSEGKFSLGDADVAYEELSRRLEPGDAECGVLVWRLHADDPAARMPPDEPLPDGERCAIVQWIKDGAAR